MRQIWRQTSHAMAGIIAVSLLVILCWARPVTAQPWQGNGPHVIDITDFTVTPSDSNQFYLAVRRAGLMKSTDSGQSWAPIGLNRSSVLSVHVDPQDPARVFAATDQGLFRSEDGGTTWTADPLLSGQIIALVVDPVNSQRIFAGTRQKVVRSTNGGDTWSTVLDSVPFLQTGAIAVDAANNNIVLVGSRTAGVFKSVDGGATWQPKNTGLNSRAVYELAVDPFSPQTYFAGTGQGIYRSTDGGESWQALNFPLVIVSEITMDPLQAGRLYASSVGVGVYVSEDGGQSWRLIKDGLPDLNVFRIAVNPGGVESLLAVSGRSGIFSFSAARQRWDFLNAPTIQADIVTVAVDAADRAVIYAGSVDQGLFSSADGGVTWRFVNAAVSFRDLRAVAIKGGSGPTLFSVGLETGFSVSFDGGQSWVSRNDGLPSTRILTLATTPGAADTVWVGTEDGVVKTVNSGLSWQRPALSGKRITAVAVDPSQTNIVYVGGDDGLYKSVDSGATWTPVDAPLAGVSVEAVAVSLDTVQSVYVGTTGQGLFWSRDGGENWQSANQDFGRIRAIAISPVAPGTIFVGGEQGVWVSTDFGLTWASMTASQASFDVAALVVDPAVADTLYAGVTGAGVQSTSLSAQSGPRSPPVGAVGGADAGGDGGGGAVTLVLLFLGAGAGFIWRWRAASAIG